MTTPVAPSGAFAGLTTAYGWAEDAPGHVAGLLSGDERAIEAALYYLDGAIVHEGMPWTATGPVAQAIAGILSDPRCEARTELLLFLAMVADSAQVDATWDELTALAHPAGVDVDARVSAARAADGPGESAGYDELYDDEDLANALYARSCLAVIAVAPELAAAADAFLDCDDPDTARAADEAHEVIGALLDAFH